MVYLTGDTHGDIDRFKHGKLRWLGKRDTVVVLGDFGFVWDGSKAEQKKLDWLRKRPYTLLFLFRLAAVPHKPEIAQHQHHVPLAQPAELAVLEAVQLAMRITCEIYHPFPPCRFVKQLQKPCHTPANLLL